MSNINNGPPNQNDNSLSNIMNMMNMFKTMFPDSQTNSSTNNSDEYEQINTYSNDAPDIDTHIDSKEISMLKTILPYVDFNTQKQLGIMIKFMELKNTLEYYNNLEEPIESQFSRHANPNKTKDMLRSIKKFLGDDEQHFIDIILKTYDMQDMLSKFKTFTPNNDYNQPIPNNPPNTSPNTMNNHIPQQFNPMYQQPEQPNYNNEFNNFSNDPPPYQAPVTTTPDNEMNPTTTNNTIFTNPLHNNNHTIDSNHNARSNLNKISFRPNKKLY